MRRALLLFASVSGVRHARRSPSHAQDGTHLVAGFGRLLRRARCRSRATLRHSSGVDSSDHAPREPSGSPCGLTQGCDGVDAAHARDLGWRFALATASDGTRSIRTTTSWRARLSCARCMTATDHRDSSRRTTQGPGRYEDYRDRHRPLPPETVAYVAALVPFVGDGATRWAYPRGGLRSVVLDTGAAVHRAIGKR